MSHSQEVMRCKGNVGAYLLVKVRIYRAMRVPAGMMTKNERPISKPWILASFSYRINFSAKRLAWSITDMIAGLDRQ